MRGTLTQSDASVSAMAKVGSGSIVTALTAAALAAVGVLAWQANAAPDHVGKPRAGSTPGAGHKAPPSQTAAQKAALALPAHSGLGKRVVYAVARHRVWLVGADGKVARTYQVFPGTVSPDPGTYAVTFTKDQLKGTDGVPIENDVLFAIHQGTPIGFSAAVDGSLPTPDPARKTGGIREHVADGQAMYAFAPKGSKVVVVP